METQNGFRARFPSLFSPIALLTLLGCLLALLSAIVRSLYLENGEETFWVAMAHRFALGDRPYVDELNAAQAASLLLAPPLWLFKQLVPGLEGIFLFERGMTFLVALGTCFVVACYLRFFVGTCAAALIALPILLFKVVGWPHWAHTSIGLSSFLIAVFTNLSGRMPFASFASGAFHALATLFYVPFVAAVVPSFFAGLYYSAPSRKTYAASFAAGGLAMVVLFFLFSGASPAALKQVLGFSAELGYKGPESSAGFAPLLGLFLNKLPHRALLVPGILGAALLLRRFPGALPWIAVATPILLFLGMPASPSPCLDLFFAWYCFAPLLYFLSPDRAAARRWLVVAWIPAGFAGCSVVLLSAGGALMSGTGFFAGSLVTSLLLHQVLSSAPRKYRASEGKTVLSYVPFLLLVLFQSLLYLDVRALKEKTFSYTSRGPWRGIWTTPENVARSEQYLAEMERVKQAGDRVLVFSEWRDGYLLQGVSPHTSYIWGCPLSSRTFDVCLNSQAAFMRSSQLVVFNRKSADECSAPAPGDESQAATECRRWNDARRKVEETHRLIASQPTFLVYRRL